MLTSYTQEYHAGVYAIIQMYTMKKQCKIKIMKFKKQYRNRTQAMPLDCSYPGNLASYIGLKG